MSEDCVVSAPDPQPGPSNEDRPPPEDDNDIGGTSPGRMSPEGNCPICLGKVENKSFTDSCSHQFCFLCLLTWSKVKAECPLCKRIFKSIIHNVRSIEDYEQYHITQSDEMVFLNMLHFPLVLSNPTWHTPIQTREPFRYRTTAVSTYLDYVVRLEAAMNHGVLPSFPPSSLAGSYTRRRQVGTSDFRRNIYQQGLWVQRMTDVTGRVRECSPEFYRENAAQSHRLVPWLNRELNVLCAETRQVQAALDRILELITQVPIRSPAFSSIVSQYTGRHTEHFVHEFHTFATSPYDLVGYDRHAVYTSQGALAHLATSDLNDDSNDSDVQIVASTSGETVSPIQLDSGSDSDDVVMVSSFPVRKPVTANPSRSIIEDINQPGYPPIEVVTLDSEDDVVQVNINVNIDSESERRKPAKKRKLRRSWLTLNNLNLPSTSSDTMNVSINFGRSRSSSPSSRSSSSSWSPCKKKKKSKKVKKTREKKGHKEKSTKCNSVQPKVEKSLENDHKESSTSSGIGTASPEGNLLSKMKKEYPGSSNEEDSDVLRIETDQELSSSGESGYKHKLRSVVIKSEIKPELESPKYEDLSPSRTPKSPSIPSPSCLTDVSINSVSSMCDSDSSDIYKPSCSYKHSKRSTSTSKHQNRKKFKTSKKKHKRSHNSL